VGVVQLRTVGGDRIGACVTDGEGVGTGHAGVVQQVQWRSWTRVVGAQEEAPSASTGYNSGCLQVQHLVPPQRRCSTADVRVARWRC
jgi:hypothetical protein